MKIEENNFICYTCIVEHTCIQITTRCDVDFRHPHVDEQVTKISY